MDVAHKPPGMGRSDASVRAFLWKYTGGYVTREFTTEYNYLNRANQITQFFGQFHILGVIHRTIDQYHGIVCNRLF